MSYADAAEYVGTTPESGAVQFAMMVDGGLLSQHHVLEIGCGALHLARPLVEFLMPGKYHGIDPNVWLRHAAMRHDQALADLMNGPRAWFTNANDFRWPRGLHSGRFDRIVSHSVLTHVSAFQLAQFVDALADQLAPSGEALVSLVFGEQTTAGPQWTYPDSVQISPFHLAELLGARGLHGTHRPEYRDRLMAVRPQEYHDWITVRWM